MDNKIKNIYGDLFSFNTKPLEDISVLEGGYIITPDGVFIPVLDGESHCAIFSQYLAKYLNQEYKFYESTKAAIELVKLNHLIYFGMKVEDSIKVTMNGNSLGQGVLFFPTDMSSLTDDEKNSCKALLDTNVSIISGREKIDLTYGKLLTGEELTKEYVLEQINTKKKQM